MNSSIGYRMDTSLNGLAIQPRLVIFLVLSLVVAVTGALLVVMPPSGPVAGVLFVWRRAAQRG